MDRLYGFQKKQAELQELERQKQLMQQRQQVLKESFTPAQEAVPGLFGVEPQGVAEKLRASIDSLTPIELKQKQLIQAQEAKPAQFDRQGAINRLYSIADLEGASALVSDDYRESLGNRASGGAAEKWYGNYKLVKGSDGKAYKHVTSSAGGSKLIPLDGDPMSELKLMDLDGKKVWANSYTGEPVREFDVIPTDYQQWQMDDNAQAGQEERVREAGARGAERGKQQAGKEADATNAGSQIAAIDRIMVLADQGYYSGTLDDRTRMVLADAFGIGADDPRYANTGSIHTLAANLLPQAKPSAMGGVSNSEWDMIREIISDPKKGSPQRYKAALNAYKSLLEGRIAAAEGGFKNAIKGYGGATQSAPTSRTPSAPMPTLPNPAQHKGRIIRDTKTGIRYQSNGSQWMRVK
jgi:hypothetical protein